MKGFLDGIPIKYPTDSITYPNITLQEQTETGDVQFNFTGDLLFIKDDYDYLASKLINNNNALGINVVLRLEHSDCCSNTSEPLFWEFYLKADNLKWCENRCEIEISATEKSQSNEQYTCLYNKIVSDGAIKTMQHPRFFWCKWDMNTIPMLIMYTIFQSIIGGLYPVILVITVFLALWNAIASTIGSDEVHFDDDPNTNIFQEVFNKMTDLNDKLSSCGYKHPSPYVRSYIENVCQMCGITFSSSILNNKGNFLYYLAYLNAPTKKGVEPNDNVTYWIEENRPLKNGITFLDELKPVFNANYKIINNILFFERRDYFYQYQDVIDLRTQFKENIISICYEFDTKYNYSYADLQYQQDGMNYCGNQALDDYNSIYEWNDSPYSANQRGVYKPTLLFSPIRTRNDGIEKDHFDDFTIFFNAFFVYKYALLMNNGTNTFPSLIIHDTQSGLQNAYVRHWWYSSTIKGNANAPMKFKYGTGYGPGYASGQNLYNAYHYIENPRVNGNVPLRAEITLRMNCELLQRCKLDTKMIVDKGGGKENTSISLDFKAQTITINTIL